MTIKLVVGLGNPGPRYATHRHNVGIWFLERLAAQHRASFRPEAKLKASLTTITVQNQDIRLLIPNTYMNESGQAVQAAAHFYKYESTEILVVHDELDFAPGTIRFKEGGGHGGHNGLRDIISKLGKQDFARLRIGIGHPGDKALVHNYVLSAPNKSDEKLILDAIDEALCHIDTFTVGDRARAVNALHEKNGK